MWTFRQRGEVPQLSSRARRGLGGALVGAAAVLHGHPSPPLLPAVAVPVVASTVAAVLARPDAPRARPVVRK
ncbi:hypothetical protein [Streptomyces sp. NPDC002540]